MNNLEFKHPNPDIGIVMLNTGDYVKTITDWWAEIIGIQQIKSHQILLVRKLNDSTIHNIYDTEINAFSRNLTIHTKQLHEIFNITNNLNNKYETNNR